MLPRVQPIAPVRRTDPFDDPGWLFDLKYDGFRALCYLEQGHCWLISRNGNLMSRFARKRLTQAGSLNSRRSPVSSFRPSSKRPQLRSPPSKPGAALDTAGQDVV